MYWGGRFIVLHVYLQMCTSLATFAQVCGLAYALSTRRLWPSAVLACAAASRRAACAMSAPGTPLGDAVRWLALDVGPASFPNGDSIPALEGWTKEKRFYIALNLDGIKSVTETSGKEATYGIPYGNHITVEALAPST
jgi:hypothetical protein